MTIHELPPFFSQLAMLGPDDGDHQHGQGLLARPTFPTARASGRDCCFSAASGRGASVASESSLIPKPHRIDGGAYQSRQESFDPGLAHIAVGNRIGETQP